LPKASLVVLVPHLHRVTPLVLAPHLHRVTPLVLALHLHRATPLVLDLRFLRSNLFPNKARLQTQEACLVRRQNLNLGSLVKQLFPAQHQIMDLDL